MHDSFQKLKDNLHILTREYLGYILVVSIGLCVDIGILLFLNSYVDLWYFFAAGISFSVAVVVNYALASSFVFKTRFSTLDLLTFFAIATLVLIVNQAAMYILVESYSYMVIIAKIITLPITFTANFILNKLFVFRS